VRGRHLLTIVGVLGVLAAPAAGEQRVSGRLAGGVSPVSSAFVGMDADGPIFTPAVNLDSQLGRMAALGVGRLRVAFDWNEAQPYRTWKDVPLARRADFVSGPGGAPTDFSVTDRIVAEAARHHLSLLPVVIYPPSWDASPRGRHVQPIHDGPYGAYLKALVHRYGPSGMFWGAHRSLPRTPITMWQIWNEPDLSYFWSSTNFARSYVALLRVAHRAIKQADPKASVVLASLTGNSWRGLATIYGVHGARDLFDVVAENTYAPTPKNVIGILRRVRLVMRNNHDGGKPLIDTEVGWPSAKGKTALGLGVSTNEAGQAAKLAQLLPLLAANRTSLGLAGFYYYTWMSTDQAGSASPFVFSGLLSYSPRTHRVSQKPAFATFSRVVRSLERGH
jgi:polysaccharide biosynthesis protein PslG